MRLIFYGVFLIFLYLVPIVLSALFGLGIVTITTFPCMSGVLTGVGEETGQEVGSSRRRRRAAGVCAHRSVCARADGAQGPRKVRGSV